MTDVIERMIANRSKEITCETCGTTATRNHPGKGIGGYTDVQRMFLDGERYYGFPLTSRMGSVIVQGNACFSCVMAQAQGKVNVLSVMTSPLPARPLRVNEMP